MKRMLVASLLVCATCAVAQGTAQNTGAAAGAGAQAQGSAGASGGQAAQQTVTIKDPAEYNAYMSATAQTNPQQKAQALESFLQTYPNSVVKQEALEQLMAAYQQANNPEKALDAANRLLQVNPHSVRALALEVYLNKAKAQQLAAQNPNDPQVKQLEDQAAQQAQQGLNEVPNMPVPPNTSPQEAEKLRKQTAAIFQSAIGLDAYTNKDYPKAQQALRTELEDTPDQPNFGDTYMLATAYLTPDNKSPEDTVQGLWFAARALALAPPQVQPQIQQYAQYYYKKYHGSLDGFDQLEASAKQQAMPPQGFTIAAAPPPPPPSQLAAQLLQQNPDLSQLALGDLEFVLANGNPPDAQKVWDYLKGKATKIAGKVISATPDSVQLATTDDDKQANKADVTVNFSKPLRTQPTVGGTAEYQATFENYTQNPFMITMTSAPAAAPTHRTPTRRRSSSGQ